jgi:hypothetical protein
VEQNPGGNQDTGGNHDGPAELDVIPIGMPAESNHAGFMFIGFIPSLPNFSLRRQILAMGLKSSMEPTLYLVLVQVSVLLLTRYASHTVKKTTVSCP